MKGIVQNGRVTSVNKYGYSSQTKDIKYVRMVNQTCTELQWHQTLRNQQQITLRDKEI